MSHGPGAAGLLWLWTVVAGFGPADAPEPSSGREQSMAVCVAPVSR